MNYYFKLLVNQGLKGMDGIPGVDGEKGQKGERGYVGVRGRPGDSLDGIYMVDVNNK